MLRSILLLPLLCAACRVAGPPAPEPSPRLPAMPPASSLSTAAEGSVLPVDPPRSGAGPVLLAYHSPAPSASSDPFALDMALSGPSVPAARSSTRLSLHSTSRQDPYWGEEYARWGGAIGGTFYELRDADFRIADQREKWDRAERFEILFHSREPFHGQVEAMIGGYFYFEERDWAEGTQKVIFDSWGFGVDMGAMLYPFEGADQRRFNLGLMPYFRLGMGWNDGDFRDIEVDLGGALGSSSGDLGNLRFDIGAGVEARAVIHRVFFVGAGVGYSWWNTASGATGTTRDGGGFVIIVDDDLTFRGHEGYIRVSAGFFF